MNTTTVRLYSYDYRMVKTYLIALVFVAGNLIFPQLAHLIPNGGPMLLPIYFFTLVGSYKYGIRVGVLTAVLSPFLNSILFGMPVVAALPIIITKSALLAVAAGYLAKKTERITFSNLVLAVGFYQLIGTGIEWALVQNFTVAIQDFRIGFPGMIFQIAGGYFALKAISKI